jgi:hypothetical protein
MNAVLPFMLSIQIGACIKQCLYYIGETPEMAADMCAVNLFSLHFAFAFEFRPFPAKAECIRIV